MDEKTLQLFDESFQRCNNDPRFLDLFYETFLDSSPKVREKFANTNFVRQKRALRASLYTMLLAAQDGPDKYLKKLSDRHGSKDLNVGAEYYDLWLDSLLSTAQQCDPLFSPEIREAWEQVMLVGVKYLCAHYND
jgi:hemoglobin-like flavoprotein